MLQLSRHSPTRRLAALLLPLLLAGCDAAGVIGVGGAPAVHLVSGTYDYSAYSDYGGRLAWWGTLYLEIDRFGEIRGRYLLPRQCAGAYGYEADCYGLVGGRVHDDGTIRFGLDEGWLANRGFVRSRYRATGDWDSRLLGYADGGRWELELR